MLIETGRIADALRDDVLILARSFVGDLVLTAEELMSLAAEDHFLPGPATLVISRPLFWAVPGAAQAQFIDLAINVNRHAPENLKEWLRRACTGRIAGYPEAPAEEHTIALAEAVATRIHASETVRASLIEVAIQAASDMTGASR